MASLNKQVKKRKASRAQFTRVLNQAKDYLVGENLDEARLISFESSVREKMNVLKAFDEEIQDLMGEEDIEEEVDKCMEFLEPSHEVFASISVKLGKIRSETRSTSFSVASSTPSSARANCKLPKLELSSFSGEPLEWQTFWNQFDVSVNENESLNDVDRFNYLLKFLSGKALAAVKGLTLSSENYRQAVQLLRERFGNPQVLISAHLDSLIKIRKVKNIENVEGLRKLYNEVETCVRNLNSLDVETKTYGCLLIPILKEKLPEEMLMVISRGFGGRVWKLDEFMNLFNVELQAKESCFSFSNRDSLKSENTFSRRNVSTADVLHVHEVQESFKKCVFCLGNHAPSQCKGIVDVNSRMCLAKRFRLCFLCLGERHSVRQCKSSYKCKNCGGKHHLSLCLKGGNYNSSNYNHNGGESKSAPQGRDPENTYSNHVGVENGVLLQTALSKVSSSPTTTRFFNSRILFDSGSQRSYISNEFRKLLGLKTIRQERIILKTFGKSDDAIQTLDVVQIFIRSSVCKSFAIEVICVPFLCDPLSNQNICSVVKRHPFLKSFELAEVYNDSSPMEVQILVGLDFYHSFFTGKTVRTKGGPTANETVLGWVLSGPIGVENFSDSSFTNYCSSHALRCSVEPVERVDSLRKDLERFWKVESLEGTDKCVIHQFEKDISFNGERYVTKLPFRPDHSPLPSTMDVAKRRLRSLRGRLEKDCIVDRYDKVLRNYEGDGIIEKVPDEEVDVGRVHYLPHTGVVRDDRETTKLRVVFDASCATKNGVSLNDCLYPGPNLISKIFDILLRFRMNPIAILSDIKQAFLQIEIDPEHRDFLRFFWFDNPCDPFSKIVTYRFLRLVFGLTSSPFILNATVRHHLNKFSENESEFVKKFLEDLYVDFERWFEGPKFLHDDSERFESFDLEGMMKDPSVLVESKNTEPITLAVMSSGTEEFSIANVIDIKKYSTLDKLLQVTSYVLRFVANLKKKLLSNGEINLNEVVSAEEREEALKIWVKAEQDELLQNSRFNKLEKSLKVFEDGFKRLKGRFGNTGFDYDVRHPLLVRGGESWFTILLVRDCHERVMHSGVEATLSRLRRRFWLVRGRQ